MLPLSLLAMIEFDLSRWDAVLFDLDGVITQTAKIHAAAWKQSFDEYLRERSETSGEPFREFDVATDYKEYVDGKLRQDGVRGFLLSRGIDLPEGDELVNVEITGGKRDIMMNLAGGIGGSTSAI